MVSFEELESADLIVDEIYEGGSAGNVVDDPLSRLLPVQNLGGFRYAGKTTNPKLLILYTDNAQPDWPDHLDPVSGAFTYYGDQRKPGREIHDTAQRGNLILSEVFAKLDEGQRGRLLVPPIFLFEKHPTNSSKRSVQFRGMLVPGTQGADNGGDLVAIWRSSEGNRFQNYCARFTVLNVPVVNRQWIDSLGKGEENHRFAPKAFEIWRESGKILALQAQRTIEIRSKESQLPSSSDDKNLLKRVFVHFSGRPFAFEHFAAQIYLMSDSNVIVDEVTRSVVDGGRDAIGRFRLGLQSDPVYVDFSLEAKCYDPGLESGRLNSVGVKEVSRLISRIRHRQFGVLVTTSVIAAQAYREVREDRHPIVFISGGDIVDILKRAGYSRPKELHSFLEGY